MGESLRPFQIPSASSPSLRALSTTECPAGPACVSKYNICALRERGSFLDCSFTAGLGMRELGAHVSPATSQLGDPDHHCAAGTRTRMTAGAGRHGSKDSDDKYEAPAIVPGPWRTLSRQQKLSLHPSFLPWELMTNGETVDKSEEINHSDGTEQSQPLPEGTRIQGPHRPGALRDILGKNILARADGFPRGTEREQPHRIDSSPFTRTVEIP